MSIDLRNIYRANPKAFIATCAVIGAAAGFLVLKGGSSSGGTSGASPKPAAHGATRASTPTTASATTQANGVTIPSSTYRPSYAAPEDSVANQQFAAGLAGETAAIAAAESLNPPSPAWTRDYRAVPSEDLQNPESYAIAFVSELLTTGYGSQSRFDLQRWVEAESAALMLPGLPTTGAQKALYGDLFEGPVVGGGPSPVATPGEWQANAKAGVRQRAYYVTAGPNPTWSSAVSKGVTSVDPLLTEVNVQGTLATTRQSGPATRHFSLVLCVGSALHHPGFGACGLNEWSVN